MKRLFFLTVLLLWAGGMTSQELRLQKGTLAQSLPLPDSVGSRLAVYLPESFDPQQTWPLLFATITEGELADNLNYLATAADSQGYILAASEALKDSVSLTTKIVYVSESLNKLRDLFPIDTRRIYTTGLRSDGQLAGLIPSMLTGVSGVLSIAAGPPNGELLSSKSPFKYVGLVNRADHNYLPMRGTEELLESKKIPNHILYFEGEEELPDPDLLEQGLALFELMEMASGMIEMDSVVVSLAYPEYTGRISRQFSQGRYILAADWAEEALGIFEDLRTVDSLKMSLRQIRRSPGYRKDERAFRAASLKEGLLREDYSFYLEEDVLSFNLNNLGWWRHQMESLRGFQESQEQEEVLMGRRLQGYVKALIDEYIRLARTAEPPDDDALILLNMLRTIAQPEAPEGYLNVISLTSKYGDYGTALFYLEELLKTGFDDKKDLYDLEHTALLRITPEFNSLVEKYLKAARYEIPDPQGQRF